MKIRGDNENNSLGTISGCRAITVRYILVSGNLVRFAPKAGIQIRPQFCLSETKTLAIKAHATGTCINQIEMYNALGVLISLP